MLVRHVIIVALSCLELHCCFDIVALVRVKTQKVAARAWRKELTMTRSTTFKSFPLNEPLSDVPNALTHWRFCFQGMHYATFLLRFADYHLPEYNSLLTLLKCGKEVPNQKFLLRPVAASNFSSLLLENISGMFSTPILS